MVMPRAAELPQHREEPFGLALVEGRIRLVEDQQPRLLQQHAAELDQLLLADAEPADRRLDIDMEAELVEQVAALLLHGGVETRPRRTGSRLTKRLASTERWGNRLSS